MLGSFFNIIGNTLYIDFVWNDVNYLSKDFFPDIYYRSAKEIQMRANKCSHAFNVLLNSDVERLEEVCASFNRSSPVIDFMFLTFYSFLSTLELNDFLLITFIFLHATYINSTRPKSCLIR